MVLKTRKIDGISFSFLNEKEFEFLYHEIFKVEEWRFIANTPSPFILDSGAHIGVSVLYFKKLYPRARIVAFEPNPDTFKLLELNIRQNNLSGVELVNAAVSNSTEGIDFYICEEASDPLTWAWANTGVKSTSYSPTTHKTIKVPTVQLSSYINQTIDFLKIDIEGMEEIVLKEIEDKLCYVEQLAIEVHSNATNEFKSLQNILTILNRERFKVAITQQNKLIRVDQIKRTEPYFLQLYANKRGSAVWWRMRVLRNMNRAYRVVTRNGWPQA